MALETRLRIGLDFDNTVIRYDDVFCGLARERGWLAAGDDCSKTELRERLVREDGDDLRWQRLQADAYGEHMRRARVFPGCREFLRWAADHGHRVFIVSHKTETSNFAPGVRLRERALAWLQTNEFVSNGVPAEGGVANKDVFFLATREEKVAKIVELRLDLFVDDLLPVLRHAEFPRATCGVHFAPAGSRREAGAVTAGSWSGVTAAAACLSLSGREPFDAFTAAFGLPTAARPADRSGNNRIIQVDAEDRVPRVIKRYLVDKRDPRPRAAAEYQALSLLWENGFRNVPRPYILDEYGSFAVFSRIEGSRPAAAAITEDHVLQAADFLLALDKLHLRRRGETYPEAADSRRCLRDYVRHIERRLNGIRSGLAGGDFCAAADFVENKLVPLKDCLVDKFIREAEASGEDLDAETPDEGRCLSPSDFGFHNALVDGKGKVHFVDFEYFGKDDPAKLVADFLHHAGQELSWEHKALFLERVVSGFAHGKALRTRLKLVVDLIGLEWLLIILNVLSPEALARKEFSNPGSDMHGRVAARLRTAEMRYAEIIEFESSASRHATVPDFSAVLG
ncbi:MAG: hypothetical protein ABIJ96_13745 [Elusimicrobiota bacterium]